MPPANAIGERGSSNRPTTIADLGNRTMATGETMHTKDRLAAALDDAGLPDMAARARQGYYDDYESPLAAPIVQLVQELTNRGALALAKRAMSGDFDGTPEEAEAWAASAKGQATMRRLHPDD